MFEKDISEKKKIKKTKGKCAAIKKPSTGRVFEFFTVFIYVGGEKNFILQCDACAVPFQWSC